MYSLDIVMGIVLAAVEEVNLQREDDQQLEVSPTTQLYGKGAQLDSLGLVNLVVAVEEMVADRFELEISLADEKAMSQTRSPFRTAQSLADYTLEQVKNSAGAQ